MKAAAQKKSREKEGVDGVHRLQVEIPLSEYAEMQACMDSRDLRTITQVVRSMLALWGWATRHRKAGATLVAIYPDGRQVEIDMPGLP